MQTYLAVEPPGTGITATVTRCQTETTVATLRTAYHNSGLHAAKRSCFTDTTNIVNTPGPHSPVIHTKRILHVLHKQANMHQTFENVARSA